MIAVVGTGCVLPGAIGAPAWTAMARLGTPAFREVPAGRWPMDPREACDPRGGPDKAATTIGAFVDDPPFDAAGLDLGGVPVHELDPLFRWVLTSCREAMTGVKRGGRADLLLGNLSLPSSGSVRAFAAPVLAALAARGIDVPSLRGGRVEDAFQSDLPAALAARALGFDGHWSALDAACASGLYAVQVACDRLNAGLCDVAVAAAVNGADSAYVFLGFTALKALSPSGASRPFDRRGDGLLVGEGAGAIALKRLDDAVRDGDTIHAVLRGGGLGNDGRKGNLLAPSAEGQLRTLRAAWKRSGLDPRELGYVECHATGTPVGDKTELQALGTLLDEAGSERAVVLSSSKALVGHTVTAAGIAGMLRAIAAVRDGFLPPIPCEQPLAAIDGKRFRVATQPEVWADERRVAAVSAFGFGGCNAHVIIERYRNQSSAEPVPPPVKGVDLAVVSVRSRPMTSPVVVDGARWKLPPLELAEMLPQHAMILEAAGDALADARVDGARTASIIGMALDKRIAWHVARWHVAAVSPGSADAITPPLTASRVQGQLPNFVANRLAALLDLQGPSYTVSAGAASIAVAIEHARRLLATDTCDTALIGAVDEDAGAIALVVKRAGDVTSADEVHAWLSSEGSASTTLHGSGGPASGMDALLAAIAALRERVSAVDGKPVLGTQPAVGVAFAHPIGAPHVVTVQAPREHRARSRGTADLAVLVVRAGDTKSLLSRVDDALIALALDVLPDAHRSLALRVPIGEGALGLGVVAESPAAMVAQLKSVRDALGRGETAFTDPRGTYLRARVDGRVALVFPGAGSSHDGMSRALWRAFPAAADRLGTRTRDLHAQTFADRLYGEGLREDAVAQIWSAAWHGILLHDVLTNELGLHVDDALGFSLGESAALVSLGAWNDCDLLFDRISTGPVFTRLLGGEMTGLRAAWKAAGISFPEDRPFAAFVIKGPVAVVRAEIAKVRGASVLLVHTDDEVTIGGPREALTALVATLPFESFPAPFAACVHAPEVATVRDAYAELHHVPTTPVAERVWSTAIAAAYVPSAEACAEAIAAQACTTVDWPRSVRAAWDAGVRVFIEVGPRASCTRWTGRVLSGLPHLAVGCDRAGRDAFVQLANAVAELAASGVEIRHHALTRPAAHRPARPVEVPVRTIAVSEASSTTLSTPTPRGADAVVVERVACDAATVGVLAWAVTPAPISQPTPQPASKPASQPTPNVAIEVDYVLARLLGVRDLAEALARQTNATADAHALFLDDQAAATDQLAAIASLVSAFEHLQDGDVSHADEQVDEPIDEVIPLVDPTPRSTPRSFDRASLERFAAGAISTCLGPAYADLDVYEPRVRLPTDPLLLVSRVVSWEGERGTFGPARIVTEYDIPVDAWWSHDGKAPPCVIVESGQADLFLVAALGIDGNNRGQRVYRLLDCDLEFQGPRPLLGTTLRHDIRIDRFARLGETTLFYFRYDCVDAATNAPVLSMRNGCAGFFTYAELKTPRGVQTPADAPSNVVIAAVISDAPRSLDAIQVEALSDGRFGDGLGSAFAAADASGLSLARAPWRTVHRVPVLETTGGPHGLGRVVVEQDLSDDDWWNPCHFVGDPCMPGTLMFDGCVQAASLWLMAMGFPAQYKDAVFEPIVGVATKLRCRGQIVPGHSLVTYDVRVKDAGLEPAPWCIADVVLSVDGIPVVLAEDVNVRISGTRVALKQTNAPVANTRREPAVDQKRVVEYSVGDPSRAFGPAYLPYDSGARVSRMPGPPYLTMTRVLEVEGDAGVTAAPRTVAIEYDFPPDAWYFRASPGSPMPWAVLLETALQPCGWLTAWQQTSIHTGPDLYFRNLDGKAVLHQQVWPWDGPLVTRATQTSVAKSGGMVIHGFKIVVHAGERLVFEGETRFGYFTAGALATQKGLLPPAADEARRQALRAQMTGGFDVATVPVEPGVLPRADLRMLDRVVGIVPDGGVAGLGFWVAEKDVVRSDWYFTAHFHEDPVTPGSLGLEALAQMARLALQRKMGRPIVAVEPVATGCEITWKYRGQIPPTRKKSVYEIEVIAYEDGPEPVIVVNGLVRGDDLPIYELKNLRVKALAALPTAPPTARATRPTPKAALLDTFDVRGNEGRGVLHLDPALHPWLADHCPTVVVPAVPMAFAAEIAAEAALLLAPGRRVIGLPHVSAEKWLHTGDGPIDVIVTATRSGDEVNVALSVWKDNPKFPKLSGPVPHMRATVRLGETWAPAPPLPDVVIDEVWPEMKSYYQGGHTFHGPVLQGMVALNLGARGARATFRTRPDADLLGLDARFALDPLLLDTATHPMMSGQTERWAGDGARGKIAYPVACDDLRFHGERPTGEIDARLALVEATTERLVFDVLLSSNAGPWASFRWTEALVDGGPVLGLPAATRRPFCWEHEPDATVRIGRPQDLRWRVDRRDVIEPLPGTLLRLYGVAENLARGADEAGAARVLAAKEATRQRLIDRIGRDVHPSSLHLLDLRPDRFVVTEATTLTAQEYVDHLGPTRYVLRVADDPKGTTAWFEDSCKP